MQTSLFQTKRPVASEGATCWLRLTWLSDTMFIPHKDPDWYPSPGDYVQVWKDGAWFQMTVGENEQTPLTYLQWRAD